MTKENYCLVECNFQVVKSARRLGGGEWKKKMTAEGESLLIERSKKRPSVQHEWANC